jgi:hypothetical protein
MSRALTAVALCLFLAAAAQAAPLVTVPACPQAPVIDGALAPGEWDHAGGPGPFAAYGGALAPVQPQVRLMADQANLYLAARLPLAAGLKPKATAIHRDGPVWDDDAFEVFLDPSGRRGSYYQLIANARGTQYDAVKQDSSWNATWTVRTGRGEDYWCAEFAIPFASLRASAPTDGETWAANFAWDCQTPLRFIGTWSLVSQSLHDSASYGSLVFRPQGPPVSFTGLERQAGGLTVRGQWGPSAGPLTAQLAVTRQEGNQTQTIAKATATGGTTRGDFALQAALPQQDGSNAPGSYQLVLDVKDAGGVVWAAEAPLVVRAPLQVGVEKFWIEGKLVVTTDATSLGLPAAGLNVALKLSDATGRTCAEAPATPLDAKAKLVQELDVRNVAPGKLQLVADLTGADGKSLRQATVALEKPARPAWLGSRAGVSDAVLAPWTPLRVSGNKVMPWGRTYSFGNLPFPSSVVTRGEEVLAGPIVLTGSVGGQQLRWEGASSRVTAAKGNVVTLNSQARAGSLTCAGTVSLEYDGMIRTDFRLAPQGEVKLDALSLEVPIKPQFAKYLYHWPGRWGSAYNAGALPAEGYHGPFKPVFWLGDEWRGLCWFSESDRNFVAAAGDKANVVDITREGDRIVLRINIIAAPFVVQKPLDYTFGFQATPVKPMTPDVWDYRISHSGNYGLEQQTYAPSAGVTYPAAGNLDPAQGTFECWVRPRFDPYPDVDRNDSSRGALNRNLFDLDLGGQNHVGFYWNIDDRGMRLYFKQGASYPVMVTTHPRWQADEWHHVAFTWGPVVRVYLDGVKAGEGKYTGLPPGDLTSAVIAVGKAPCEMDLDDIRVSSVPRESFDLTQPLAADAQTLLLDHLDEGFKPDGRRATTPARGKGGVVAGGGFYEGKFGRALGAGPVTQRLTQLDHLAEIGVRTICFHEHWTDIQAYPATTHGDRLRSLVAGCHASGLQLLLYHGYLMSDIAPEWDNYHDECLVYPQTGAYTRQPKQTAYTVCYRGPWQDFLADGLDKELTEYGTDGVYLDGTSEPWGCRNLHHGCGYVKPDGSIGTTYPIFATRAMMKRIYTIVKAHNPQGQVNVHQSTCMTIPTLAWATSYWDGEQFGSIDRGPFALEVLSLDAFRCEFMGHQWGVPAEFLCYNRPYTLHEATAFTLLHDVLVRGDLEENAKLWKLMDDFGRKAATWLPYWENSQFVRTSTPDLKVSLYNRPGKGVVAVISNLGREATAGTVSFDFKRLRQPAGLQAYDVMVEGPRTLKGSDLPVDLKPLDFTVVWLKAK